MLKSLLLSSLALTAMLTTASHAVLVSTWTAPQDAGSLGNPSAGAVLLSPSPVVNHAGAGAALDFSVSANVGVTDFTDVVVLTAAQQAQLASAGLAVTQGLNNVRGATRKLIGEDFEGLGNIGGGPPNVTQRDATFDLFLSPDNLNDVSQLIFETGGSGAGISLNMNSNILTFAAGSNAATAVTTTIDLDPLYDAVPDTTNMLHVRASIDLANDLVTLSTLNLATGLSANSSVAFTGNDWAGSDNTGFFNFQGSTGASAGGNVPGGYSNYDGQFAGLSFYASEVLNPIPEPSSAILVALSAGLLARRRR